MQQRNQRKPEGKFGRAGAQEDSRMSMGSNNAVTPKQGQERGAKVRMRCRGQKIVVQKYHGQHCRRFWKVRYPRAYAERVAPVLKRRRAGYTRSPEIYSSWRCGGFERTSPPRKGGEEVHHGLRPPSSFVATAPHRFQQTGSTCATSFLEGKKRYNSSTAS